MKSSETLLALKQLQRLLPFVAAVPACPGAVPATRRRGRSVPAGPQEVSSRRLQSRTHQPTSIVTATGEDEDAATAVLVAGSSDVSRHFRGTARRFRGAMYRVAVPSVTTEHSVEQLNFGVTPPAGVTKDTLVGGRLQSFRCRWASLFPDSSVSSGIRWLFTEGPPPLTKPPIHFPAAQQYEEPLRLATETMLQKHATEVVDPLAPSPGFYSRLFLVPKPTGSTYPL